MLNTFGNPQCSIVTFRICWLVKYQYLDLILLQTAKWHFQQLHKCKTCRGPDICTHYTRHPYSCTFFLLKSIVPSKMSTTVWNTFPLFGRACKQLISSRFLLHTIGQTMFSQLATGNKNYKMHFSFFFSVYRFVLCTVWINETSWKDAEVMINSVKLHQWQYINLAYLKWRSLNVKWVSTIPVVLTLVLSTSCSVGTYSGDPSLSSAFR